MRIRWKRRTTNLGLVKVHRVGFRVTSVTTPLGPWSIDWWTRARGRR
jgi:hypothetical protein